MPPTITDYGRVYETDVLVIGGGTAGTNAAMGAAEHGARVLVVDKAWIERSGAIGGGVDQFMGYLNSGEEWDTREAYLRYCTQLAKGAVNLKVQNALFCRELPFSIERMERIGCSLKEKGRWHRTQSLGMPGPYFFNFNGKYMKPNFAKEVKRLGCKVVPQVAVTDLLTQDGQVIGAVGFHHRRGEYMVFKAKSVILSTGNTNRIFENPSGLAFNTWQCPANTGAGHAMAFRAGARLANMEYVRLTVVPKGFSAAGLNALMGAGGRLRNGAGEEFMARYHPMGNKAPRYKLVEGVYTETRDGRGPVVVDTTQVPLVDMDYLNDTLGYDKDTLPDFLAQKGIVVGRDPIEVYVSEGMQSGPSEICASGIMIDEHTASSLPGLFAAGDGADQTRCLHLAVTAGYVAGREAAWRAQGLESTPEPDLDQVLDLRRQLFAPLYREGGTSHQEFEDVIRRVMWEYCGPIRSETSLKTALAKLDNLMDRPATFAATDLHDLMRAQEAEQIFQVARISAAASLFRQETRFGIYHNRIDYPRTDDENWCGQVVVRKDGEGVALSFQPLTYEIPPELPFVN